MAKKNLDDEIHNELKKLTDDAVKMKDDIWKEIEKETITLDKKTRKTKRRRKISFVASIAASIGLIYVLGTPTGHALMANMKDLLAPNKTITEQLEGTDEPIDYSLNIEEKQSDTLADYAIYVDEEMYTITNEQDRKIISANIQSTENIYPDVFMEIKQTENSIEDTIVEISKMIQEEYEIVKNQTEVQTPISAHVLEARQGDEWNDEVVRFYIFSNEKGGTFIVKQQFFFEAYEGHGVRMDNMLKTFELIK
ncbi:MAG: hypothetical protein LPK00_04625 [Bacillaceae bacterium]|nr:hypothetical protein [Bacillaceae bacterium]